MEPFEKYCAENVQSPPTRPALKYVLVSFALAIICAGAAVYPNIPLFDIKQATITMPTKTAYASAHSASTYYEKQ